MSCPPAPRAPARKPTSVVQLFDIPVVVSADTVFDVARLAACCAPVPGLAPVVETLRSIHASVERISWNKSLCRKLSTKAMTLVFVICDHCENERAETPKLQTAVEGTVQAMQDIEADVRAWAAVPFWTSWYSRHDVEKRIAEHEEKLKTITELLSLAATVRIHDKIAALQESLKNNPSGIADRKRAEEQLYRLRNAPPGELTALIPSELACECVRLGSQPEYGGTRNDVWKGRWLDKQDVALIFYKEYKMGERGYDGIRRFERQIKMWRRLDNPHILRLYGWCKFDGETYLVCPWLRNRDVLLYLEGDRGRHRKCLSLITEIALGLRYLQNQGVIHGNLKPSNILVQDDGRAVLSDFSLAKLARPDARNTQTNPQVAVFRYQAPEVILDEPISTASDVYSWAMTALEIVTGDPPFHTWKSPGQLVAQVIMQNKIPNRSDYNSPVLDKHPEIWNLFVQCWNRQATERPTAKEIVEVLESITAHEDEHESGTEGPAPTLDPSTKSAFSLTTGSDKWVKFVTVVPSQHGRFRIHVGTPPIYGGFSDVWRCDARFSDGRVIVAAVKKFRAVRIARDADASTATNKLLKRLTKELDIWMALQHPHISPLLGFVLEDDLCIISPWYTNGNVTEYIGRHPEVDRIKLVSDVASGLAYLHTRVPPVVHGDMKADNVLIDDAGNAVIIDFGLSAIVEDDPALATSLAATSSSLQDAGNARWMAPELLMEEGCTRSSSTDVYSFGCVALQIYTGEIPFKDVPTFRIVYVLIQGQKPLDKREDYPATQLCSPSLDWFYDLLLSCWDGNPTARPSMVDVESKLRMGGQ